MKNGFYGMLFKDQDEFDDLMKHRDKLPKQYREKYEKWVADGSKNVSTPPAGFKPGNQKKKTKTKKVKVRCRPVPRTRRKLSYDEDEEEEEEDDFDEIRAFDRYQQMQRQKQREEQSSSQGTPTKKRYRYANPSPPSLEVDYDFQDFDQSPLPFEDTKWDIAEALDCPTKDLENEKDTRKKQKKEDLKQIRHTFRVRLTNGEIITHYVDVLHRYAKDSEFLRKCIVNKQMGGMDETYMEDGYLKFAGFPDCYNIKM